MKKALPIILIALLIVVFGAVWIFSKKELPQPFITNYEECAKAGYPILETYPEQCKTPDGRSFARSINSSGTEFGSPVTLRLNEQTKFNDGLTVTLVEINDSRCPSGVVCIWAGELAFRFKLLGGNINQDTEIKLGTAMAKSVTQGAYTFILGEATEYSSIIIVTKGGGQVACTQEAKLCPDGSYVSRTGPNCEFAPCPSEDLCEGGLCLTTSPVGRQCDGSNDTSCPADFECVQECGPPVVRYPDTTPLKYYCQLKGYIRNCPICLAKNTLIDTPLGAVVVQDLKIGTPVWTINASGERVVGFVTLVGKTAVPLDHKMMQLVLKDGRTLLVSPGHPTIDGRVVGEFAPGVKYDGSQVVSIQRVSYGGGYTYDLLPPGETGFYFANGILLDSTLH